MFSHPGTQRMPAPMVQGGLAIALIDGRPLCCPYHAGNHIARAVRSGKFPPRFQGKAWMARQYSPEKAVCETIGKKM